MHIAKSRWGVEGLRRLARRAGQNGRAGPDALLAITRAAP